MFSNTKNTLLFNPNVMYIQAELEMELFALNVVEATNSNLINVTKVMTHIWGYSETPLEV